MSGNYVVGLSGIGTYIQNCSATGTIGGTMNFNGTTGVIISGNNSGNINTSSVYSKGNGIVIDSSSRLTNTTFSNITSDNNTLDGVLISNDNLNYQTPLLVNINRLQANNNGDAGLEAYNISGNLTGLVINNNTNTNIKTSLGNAPTIFDRLTSIINTKPQTLPYTFNGTPILSSPSFLDGSFKLKPSTADTIIVPYSSNLNILSGDFTVESWINPFSYGNAQFIIGQWNQSGGNGGFGLSLNLNGSVNFSYGPISLTNPWLSVAINVNSNNALSTWSHVAISRTNNNFIMYINGVPSTSACSIASRSQIPVNITLGNYYNASSAIGATGANYFDGYISNTRITKDRSVYNSLNVTIPSNELSATNDSLYNNTLLLLNGNGLSGAKNTTIVDSSTANLTITNTNSGNVVQGSFSPYSPNGWSGYFNGSSTITLPVNNTQLAFGSNNYTIEFWVYFTSLNTASFNSIYSSQGSNTTGHVSIGASADAKSNFVVTYYNGSTRRPTARGTTTAVINKWYHIAAVRSSNTTKLFVDGKLEAFINDVVSVAAAVPTIGNNPAASTTEKFYGGYISNFRIATQALYDNNFIPSTAPLTITSQGATSDLVSLLTLQNKTFIDNSLTAKSLTANNTPVIQTFNPFNTNTQYTPSIHGGSGYFNGSNYLTIPANNGFSLTGDFTIEFWINTTTWTGDTVYDRTIISMGTGADAADLLKINFSNNAGPANGLRVYTNSSQIVGATGVANGTWRHVALTRSGTDLKLFLDGVQTGSTVTTSQVFNKGATTDVQIGRFNNAINGRYIGYISNLRIVNGVAITPPIGGPTAPVQAVPGTSLLLNFNNAGIYDTTGIHTLSSNRNAINISPFSKYGSGSIFFNGADHLSLVTNTGLQTAKIGTGNFTVECWVYPTIVDNTYRRIITSSDGVANVNYLLLRIDINNKFESYVGSTSIVSTTTVQPNTWYHYSLSRINGTVHLTINGVIERILPNINANITESSFTIGGYFNNAGTYQEYFAGYIDDFRITIGNTRYTNVFTPSRTTPLSLVPNTGFLLDYNNTYKHVYGLDLRNVCMSILTGYNTTYETIIKNSYLSASTVDTTLSSSVGLSLNSTRFTDFGIDNSSILGNTNIELNAPRGLIEGTYHLNNSKVGTLPIGSGLAGVYQPSNSMTNGFVYTNFNQISGYNISYVNGGQRSTDSTITYIDITSERLTPFSNINKLRSGSKYVALNASQKTLISVYVRVDSTYTGTLPKLILKSNPSIGIMQDVIISTATNITNTFQRLYGNAPIVTNDGVLEFYVECDGTSGFINIDNWEAI
jgi:hypothetical protein